MRKIVQLHKRRQGCDIAAFQSALVEAAANDPGIQGLSAYVQSHTLLKGYQKGELLFDAVEEFAFSAADAADAFARSPDLRAITAKREPWLDLDRCLMMLVDVHRVKDKPVPSGAVKNIEFVNRRPGMELDAFRRYWREVHGPIGSKIPSILRYEQNHLAKACYEADQPPPFDGLAITWFASTAAMREGAASEAYEITRADEANFLPDGHLPIIITKEVLSR